MLIYQGWIARADLRSNPDVLYLFGDNFVRRGRRGQAKEMRGEPNALGIATKKWPGMKPEDFMTDDEFETNVESFRLDLRPAFVVARSGGVVICPRDGLGTGLSQLPDRAPRSCAALETLLDELSRVRAKTSCLCNFDGGMAR